MRNDEMIRELTDVNLDAVSAGDRCQTFSVSNMMWRPCGYDMDKLVSDLQGSIKGATSAVKPK